MSVDIINQLSELAYSEKVSVLRKQIFRSSSSSAANYRAMCRVRSTKERYSKICIVVEEADETLFWIDFMQDLKMFSETTLNKWFNEAEEIVKATSSYKRYLKEKLTENQ
ncbi:four helix bundle protein [Epilithonimonas zeae]|uniref:four helix bundle protein n=1 Tax=Epilithonimonas zeae TaxID=1416779 RepID=UPI00200F700B|nr:four helix bundle protein [Epilithonimonas zeae]